MTIQRLCTIQCARLPWLNRRYRKSAQQSCSAKHLSATGKWRNRIAPGSRRSFPAVQSASIDLTSIAALIDEAINDVSKWTEEEEPDATLESLESNPEFRRFKEMSEDGNLIPLFRRVFSDHLTPILAFRCLVRQDDRNSPSFLLESVVNGSHNGRFSLVGSRPVLEVTANGKQVVVLDHEHGTRTVTEEDDPLEVLIRISRQWRPVPVESLPEVFTGGWVGYAGYDTVRYVYPDKIPLDKSPEDDRKLPDLHFSLYNDVMVFDNVGKVGYMVTWTQVGEFATIEDAYLNGLGRLKDLCKSISKFNAPRLLNGFIDLQLEGHPKHRAVSNMTKEGFTKAVGEIKEHIQDGDIFQLVYSQRFERRTFADPFEVYRALRVVNPSPYMAYLQTRGCILVASSPEILCRVDNNRVVTNRPLAGTRPRGSTADQDRQYQADLLADEKERSEHIMLVDLGRNDVGKVCEAGTVTVEKLMAVERYSHVMHISSTVTGKLKSDCDCWDALRAALPAGTISGAPKVRAMQIIDELEVNKRGPYGGGFGHISFTGSIDMALALRTLVVPSTPNEVLYKYKGINTRREWVFHIQSGAGIVADSDPDKEYEETLNKAAALGRAIDLAERAFLNPED